MTARGQASTFRSSLKVKTRRFSIASLQYLVLFIVAVLAVAPLILMWSSAFKSKMEIAINPIALPKSLDLSNLVDAWTVGRYSKYSVNSVIVTVPTVLGVVALSTLAGYAFARLNFFGKKVFFYLLLLGLMVPFQSIMIPLYFDLRKYGLLNTYLAVILPGIALGLPFGIYLMQAFFRGLPRELSDSARVDGCNEFQVFWKIILPLTSPAVTSLAIFQLLWTWNAFLMPLIYLNTEARRTLPLGLMFFQSKYVSDYSLISAGVLITSFPMIVVYLLLQRRFLRGLTAGAIKG
jgi:ABC-type glycerol-3-phosphate transport system permease component